MSEHEDILKRALAENIQFKAEKADAVRKESTADFRKKMQWAERIMWIYLLACVVVGVLTLNAFGASDDTKTLLTCLLVLVVVYETTVLMKLWYVIAGTKIGVLKEIKQLRLEVSQLATAAGVASPSDVLSAKYEPVRGASKLERRVWLVVLIVAAAVASSAAHGEYDWLFDGGQKLSADSLVTLAADGAATSVTTITQTHSGMSSMTSFPFHAPKTWTVRWVDSHGREMPYTTTPRGSHIRYDVSLPPHIESGEPTVYTRMAEIPQAATQTDDVWTYAGDTEYGFEQNDFTATVLLPPGAELVSVEPKPVLEFTPNGLLAFRFQGARGRNEKFEFKVRYRLAEVSGE